MNFSWAMTLDPQGANAMVNAAMNQQQQSQQQSMQTEDEEDDGVMAIDNTAGLSY